MDFDESEFKQSQMRYDILLAVQQSLESWPDVVALYSGMVQQLINDGWEPIAARSIVLSNVTSANISIAANIPGCFDGEKEA